MNKFLKEFIFNKKSILSSCEGIRKSNSKIILPNFHAIQYYIETPKPQIVGKILDFGLTSRFFLNKKLNLTGKEGSNIKSIEKILQQSFDDMAEIVIHFIFDLFLNDKLDYLYSGAIPHPFIENIKYNPWGDFIQSSRQFKLNNLKKSLYENLIKFLEFEITAIKDEKQKQEYKYIIKQLKTEIKKSKTIIIKHIDKVIKNAEFIKDLYSKFFDPPVAESNYEGEIILTKVAA